MRKQKVIRIEKIADLSNFVRCAEGSSSDIIVSRGRFVADGRSLLGVLSINPSEPFTVEYDEVDVGFDTYVSNFEVM